MNAVLESEYGHLKEILSAYAQSDTSGQVRQNVRLVRSNAFDFAQNIQNYTIDISFLNANA